MRVGLFVDTLNIGGAETLVVDLGQALRAQGVDAVVLHFGNTELVARCARCDVPTLPLPAYRDFKAFVRLPRFAVKFARFLRAQDIDLLHSHLFGPIVAGAFAARLASIRHVGTLHDQLMIDEVPGRIRQLQVAALMGTRLVAVSEITSSVYRKRGWFPRGEPATIYNGIAIAEPAPKDDSPPVQLISVGRLVSLKRYDRLIRVFAEVARSRSATLRIVGDGPERESLEKLAERAAAPIEFIGHVTDVSRYLAQAHAFALTSDTEALSRSVLEAMGAGLPCVVTDVGGNRELVQDGETGFVVPAEDESLLVSRLDELLGDATLRRTMGRAGWRRAHHRFSLKSCAEAYAGLYSEIV
ncbi:MAG: glycosyltransferase family 4 protein [Myxococcota bacterium]